MPAKLRLIVSIVLLAAASGCGSTRPLLGPQGTVQQQRSQAAIYDPYVANDLGPEVVGGRPRDFQNPRAEPVRAQWSPFAGWWGR